MAYILIKRDERMRLQTYRKRYQRKQNGHINDHRFERQLD